MYIFTLYTSARTQLYEKSLEMIGFIDDPNCPRAERHCELEKVEIKKSEMAVKRVLTAVRNFINPFTNTDKEHIWVFSPWPLVPLPTLMARRMYFKLKSWATLRKLTLLDA